jgi:hypothetical protein
MEMCRGISGVLATVKGGSRVVTPIPRGVSECADERCLAYQTSDATIAREPAEFP